MLASSHGQLLGTQSQLQWMCPSEALPDHPPKAAPSQALEHHFIYFHKVVPPNMFSVVCLLPIPMQISRQEGPL